MSRNLVRGLFNGVFLLQRLFSVELDVRMVM